MGLEPIQTSLKDGGEYHSPCPGCGGKDRFIIWPGIARYWCRQCDAKGDSIQFCRDFQGLTFQDARKKVLNRLEDGPPQFRRPTAVSMPRVPSNSWKKKAAYYVEQAHQRLLIDKAALNLVAERGLTIDAIKQNQLGWNPIKKFPLRTDWGLEETNKQKWLCLPAGVVIPIFDGGSINKIKIRKSEWQKDDLYGKYYEVPGSSNNLPILGDPSKEVVVVVEAEFDAMLIVQEAGEFCSCLALGGAQKRPNHLLREWLLKKKLVIFALDFDATGKNEYIIYWGKSYPNLEPWPVPEEKSPGDYYAKKGSIREWITDGIKNLLK